VNSLNTRKSLILVALIVSSSQAHAYLDPGTGSMLLQGAIAGIATLAFTMKIYWHRIKAFISGKPYIPLDLSEDDDLAPNEESGKNH
jgi:hypothetical protein